MRDVGCDELSLEMCLTPPQNIFDPKNDDTMQTDTSRHPWKTHIEVGRVHLKSVHPIMMMTRFYDALNLV